MAYILVDIICGPLAQIDMILAPAEFGWHAQLTAIASMLKP